MSHNLLALASRANEAALALSEAVDDADLEWSRSAREHLERQCRKLLAALAVLTGAVLEHANEAPIEIPLDDLTRLREIEDVAARLGKTIPEAIVWLVNSRLSGSFHDGYNAALEQHNVIVTPVAEVGDGYAHDEPERDEASVELDVAAVDYRAWAQAAWTGPGRYVMRSRVEGWYHLEANTFCRDIDELERHARQNAVYEAPRPA